MPHLLTPELKSLVCRLLSLALQMAATEHGQRISLLSVPTTLVSCLFNVLAARIGERLLVCFTVCYSSQYRHLIADHLGWFKDSTEDGTLRTIEEILSSKGESVKRGVLPSLLEPKKVVEYAPGA